MGVPTIFMLYIDALQGMPLSVFRNSFHSLKGGIKSALFFRSKQWK